MLINQNILRLKISVANAQIMTVLYCLDNLTKVTTRFPLW